MSKLVARDPRTVIPRPLTVLIYGQSGVGKTIESLGFPAPLQLDIEGGATQPYYTRRLADNHGAYVGPDDGALDFDFVLSQVVALATEKHEFKTLVVDSFSKLFATEVAKEWDRMRSRGQNMSSTYGAEKKPAINLTRQLIRRLDKLNMTTLLVCHETTAWSNGQANGQTFDSWDKLKYELDLTLRIVANGTQRVAKVEKSRVAGFTVGSGFPWSYQEFARRQANKGVDLTK